MDRNCNSPLPSKNNTEDTSQIQWKIDEITIVAKRNEAGLWNVYAMEKDIIFPNVTKNVSNEELLFVVEEYKNRYYEDGFAELVE